MKNRYGNIIGGKYHYTRSLLSETYQLSQIPPGVPSLTPRPTGNDYDYEYGSKTGGIWGIESTFTYPKNNSIRYDSSYTGLTKPVGSILAYNTAGPTTGTWQSTNIDISKFANRSARVVFKFINESTPVFPYTSPFWVDFINISGNIYGFETSAESFETSTAESYLFPYASITWSTVGTTATRPTRMYRANATTLLGQSAANGNFGFKATVDGTYGELTNNTIWLRSPVVALGATPTLSFSHLYEFTVSYSTFVYLDLQ